MNSYRETLDKLTQPAHLTEPSATPGALHCTACAHHCRIRAGARGICSVRFNRDGSLYAPWGYAASIAADPIEKKPFFHLLPGACALSFGMLGCSFHCAFCQNWSISQALRDADAGMLPHRCSPGDLVAAARRCGAKVIAGTYNEPLITAEWARDVFTLARDHGMKTCMVSNGFASPAVLTYLDSCLDAMNVDLKCFSDKGYRWLGGRLEPVLECIRALRRGGTWVEVTTLVVPGFNDSDGELRQAAEFLAGVDPDIPWHVSAYHPDYKLHDGPPPTPRETLQRALRSGRDSGLHHVYAGNARGIAGAEDTFCPDCGTLLVQRRGFTVQRSEVGHEGRCPHCGRAIAGVWA
ncbi:MAG: AmmeMemoRadiSam system radical SAM enzyme [Lentisphaeria bacterium]|nr:AmmeMemoRadiSam system radical SAM enzyme [Lentisphaeria bacterium]